MKATTAHIAVMEAGDELAEPGARRSIEPRRGKPDRVEPLDQSPIADRVRHPQPRPRYGATPGSGTHSPAGGSQL